ncbi:ADP-ribosyltransferase [Methanoregula sp.]|jgi:hypothetical protein|uniref:ADP-ribosyltransferase n=1 Tax=Methanoregula sp. TaxID=2052170 RepID=UPI003562D693
MVEKQYITYHIPDASGGVNMRELFNENHDPENGQFAEGGGSGDSGGSSSKGSGSVKDSHKSAISAGTMDERSKEDYADIASAQESKLSSDTIEYGKAAYDGNLEETEGMYMRDTALKDYCNEEYSVINANLRGEHYNEYRNFEDVIDTSIESAPPIPEGLELYRGVGTNSGQVLAGKEIGDVCQDAAYQSHSLNPATAGGFAKGWEDEEGNTHKTVIRAVTSGKEKGLYINNEAHWETELIIARDTSWKIVGKEEFTNDADERVHVVTVMKYEEE